MAIRFGNPKPEERRESRRVGCKLQVMNDALGTVTDISEGGARFNFHHAVSIQEDLDVPIKISDRIIWARLHPRWVQPASAPQTFDLGGSFATISDEDRALIRAFVEKRLQRPFGFNFVGRYFGH